MAHEPAKPQLTIVIGANGSGKTTWAQQSRAFLPKPFYNADSIAEGLGDPNNTTLQEHARRIVDQAIEDDLAHAAPTRRGGRLHPRTRWIAARGATADSDSPARGPRPRD